MSTRSVKSTASVRAAGRIHTLPFCDPKRDPLPLPLLSHVRRLDAGLQCVVICLMCFSNSELVFLSKKKRNCFPHPRTMGTKYKAASMHMS